MTKALLNVLVALMLAAMTYPALGQGTTKDIKAKADAVKAETKKADSAKGEVKKAAAKAAPAASEAEIAAAQKAGKVWVNTDTKVYHKGGRWFGKTKEGKFMTEDEAKKAGFTAAKSEIGEKKK